VKTVYKVILWVFSVAFFLMALVMLLVSVLSGAMLLGCAVLLNPLFIERIQLKKGLTALLVIGLFIGSVAVFPSDSDANANQAAERTQEVRQITPEPTATGELLRLIPADISRGQETEESLETASASPTPTSTPTPTATPTASPTATSTPKPTATPRPTENPTPTPQTASKVAPVTLAAGITIIDYSDSVSRGAYAFIKIQGAPNTDYDCEVEYKSGMSEADGLGVKRSDGEGYVSWKWKVGTRTSLDYTPTIYIDGGGDSISVDFEVTK